VYGVRHLSHCDDAVLAKPLGVALVELWCDNGPGGPHDLWRPVFLLFGAHLWSPFARLGQQTREL